MNTEVRSRFLPSRVLLALVTVTLWTSPAIADDHLVKTTNESYSLGSADALSVHLPVGALEIRASDASEVKATLEVSCKSEQQTKCLKAAESLQLTAKRNRKWLELTINQWPRMAAKQPDVRLLLEVPKTLRQELDVGVGEIEIEGTEGSLEVDLGVGKIFAALPLATISRVELDTGVGEASLDLPAGTVDGKGFVGSSVSWSDGAGLATVEVDVGVGKIEIELN